MALMMMQLSSRQCHGTPLLLIRLLLLRFLALDAKGGETVEYVRDRGACEWVDSFVCLSCIMFTFMHL